MAGERWMIYGANGFTGALIAEEAVRRGHRPLLVGRSDQKLAPLAEKLGLEWQAVALDDPLALVDAVGGVDLVVHAAGPFIHTSAPMIRACLAARAHYVDITGEIAVFQTTFAHDAKARERGVVLLPGAGFDVVPTDCMALYVAGRVPHATRLELAFAAIGSASAGTTKTTLESASANGLVRRGGQLVPQPMGTLTRRVRFSDQPRDVMAIPWGDLETAYRSTGIPSITTYMATPQRTARTLRRVLPIAAPLLRLPPVKRAAQRLIEQRVKGPDEQLRSFGKSLVWAWATNAAGETAEAWLSTVEGYRFTAEAVVRCVEQIWAQQPRGALTPGQAFGADFVLGIPGTQRFDQLTNS